MAVEFPIGTVTLVFTDIQGSSTLWDRYVDSFLPVLNAHNQLMRLAAERWRGYEVKTEGDAFFLSFGSAADAVQFAAEVQRELRSFRWSDLIPELTELLVRIGMHTGEPLVGRHPDGMPDYFGPVVNRAARVGAAGHGGQILISEATRAEAESSLPGAITLRALGNHRLKGVGEEHLWQVCHPELLQDFPVLKTFNPQRHNLPLPPTPFVGRHEEVNAWSEALRKGETRLLTILGSGGMGKTRVALQIAELLSDDYADGVWWVDLQEARTGEEIIQRASYQLRLQVQPQVSLRDQIAAFLAERQLLLVLDNTEQIPDAGRAVDSLLKAGSGVQCIVTTRRPLELLAERLVELSPLPGSDAETLFVESARMRRSDFALTPENASDVAELCRQLEGVPLAIELAASRILMMSPREMLGRLGERFRLLQTRTSDLPPRQRALRAAIDWSYELLSEDDQSLFAQLAVFHGGFTMESAENICEAFDVFEGVLELRRHSLLRVETDVATQQTRYFALESVRAYMEEKLQSALHSGAEISRRHAVYFDGFAQQRMHLLGTPAEARALEELGAEIGNLRAGMAWAAAHDEPERCANLALPVYRVLYDRGFWTDARECLEQAWSAVSSLDATRAELQGAIAYRQADLALHMGDREEARGKAEAALELRRACGDAPGIADVLTVLSILEKPERSGVLLNEALALLAEGDHARRGRVIYNLARLSGLRGQHEEARRLYEQALHHYRLNQNLRGEAKILSALGWLSHSRGDLPAARDLYHQSLAIRRRLEDREGIGILLNNLGELAETDDCPRAVALFIASQRIFQELQSEYISVPGEGLQRLRERLGSDELDRLAGAWSDADWRTILDLTAG